MIKRNKLQAVLSRARRRKFITRKALLSRIVMRNEFKFDGRLNKPGILRRHYFVKNGTKFKSPSTGIFGNDPGHGYKKAPWLLDDGLKGDKVNFKLHPYQQDAIDKLNAELPNSTPEERDYFNMWTQGGGFSTPFSEKELAAMALVQAKAVSRFDERMFTAGSFSKEKHNDNGMLYDIDAISSKAGFIDPIKKRTIAKGKTIMIDSMSEVMDKSIVHNHEGDEGLAKFIERNIKLRSEAKKQLLDISASMDIPTGFGPINKMLDGGFKHGELILTGAVPHFGTSRYILGSIEATHGPKAYVAMLAVEKSVKEEKPEATEAEVFVEIHKQLTPLQRGSLYRYAEYLKKSMEAGIVEEIAGAFEASLEIYKHITSFTDFINSGLFIKSSVNMGEESKEDKKDV